VPKSFKQSAQKQVHDFQLLTISATFSFPVFSHSFECHILFFHQVAQCRSAVKKLAATLWRFTAAPKPLKIQVFGGSQSPQGLYRPYILGDTTKPGHVTCVLVLSKLDRRRLRKTLHKQTDKHTDTTKIMVTWP